eukprot:GABV01000973.1.p1 GENE.GABV01000973.1~~GABV01000973.1.p1  ORF type:complete len:258 (+),score=91.59 GABV01000973.1:186-959(+)
MKRKIGSKIMGLSGWLARRVGRLIKIKKKRSNTTILIKNIPFDTTEGELEAQFKKFGTVGRVLLPPTRAIAIVEFLHANDAKTAFKRLAYKKFKHVPLYLEWAPEKMFDAAHQLERPELTVTDQAARASGALKKQTKKIEKISFASVQAEQDKEERQEAEKQARKDDKLAAVLLKNKKKPKMTVEGRNLRLMMTCLPAFMSKICHFQQRPNPFRPSSPSRVLAQPPSPRPKTKKSSSKLLFRRLRFHRIRTKIRRRS